MSEIGNRILSLKYNNANTLLYVSTTQGFRIVNLEQFKIISRRDRLSSINFQGGFKIILPLQDAQKILLVGTRSNEKFKENSFHIWDDYHAKIMKSFEFNSDIKNIYVRSDCIAVFLESSVTLYNTTSWKTLVNIDNTINPHGVGAMNQQGNLLILLPGNINGQVRLENITEQKSLTSSMHENPINCLALNINGTFGASSSEYGTVIRIFSCENLQVLHELRRGTISAKISSLCFNKNSDILVAASNKSTIHIWNLDVLSSQKPSWMLPSYFQYQRSYCKVRIIPEILWVCDETAQIGPCVCITDDNFLYIAHLDGNIYVYQVSSCEPVNKALFCFLDFEEEFVEDEHEWTSLE